MPITPEIPETDTGVLELLAVPLPSDPYWLFPQQAAAPVESTAHV
jgi:hypothetical protein